MYCVFWFFEVNNKIRFHRCVKNKIRKLAFFLFIQEKTGFIDFKVYVNSPDKTKNRILGNIY